ncbi:ATP-binding protein [Pseudonocardia bannensis]|uniref:Sensor histidine kinase n=1 Tax=Pseudonocardia bannensis TaxID=630973 RepID=A0A848DSZ4_9PSEU|nr:ATP-binding protein [Pseudonocardia bannensis]NMH95324.1 sensor histidine kinase [Pseudonocardia bannensis]
MTAGPLRHEGVLYRDLDDLVAAVAEPLAAAVRGDQAVGAIVDAPTERALRDRLGDAADAVVFQPPEEAFAEPAQTVVLRRVLEAARLPGTRRATVLGQHQPWMNTADVALWDAAFNVALAAIPMTLLCACPTAVTDASAVVRATHPALRSADGIRPNPGYREPLDVLRDHPPAEPEPLGPSTDETAFGAADLSALRHRMARHGERAGLADRIDDLVLAVSEIATNSIEHGAGSGLLRVWTAAGNVTCDVLDAGPFRPSLLGLVPPPLDGHRGRGLWTARLLCDRVHLWFSGAGTGVRLTVTA